MQSVVLILICLKPISSCLVYTENQVNLIRERDGLRVEIIDKANFSMFGSGNASMSPKAASLINEVAKSVANMPNKLSVKGHTDSSPFPEGSERTN